MVRILDSGDVRELVDLSDLLSTIEWAFERQGAGAVERPERPHFPVGIGLDRVDPDRPAGTGLVMPAYIHGSEQFVTKLVSVHEENADRDLPTVNAQVAVNDAETGKPLAYMDGTYVTAARTGCIGGLSARELTDGSIAVGVIGAGTQARWQVRAIAAATTIESATFYDIDAEAAEAAVTDLSGEIEATLQIGDEAASVVESADLVVTATTSAEPVFPGSALQEGTVVVAIGAYTPEMQEIDNETVDRAGRIFADVPEEVVDIGDVADAGVRDADLLPFSTMLARERPGPSDEIVLVESVGSAIMDAAAASHLYEASIDEGVGSEVTLRG